MKKLAAAAAALAMFASPALAVDLTGAGATFPAPLYFAWIQQYQADHKDVRIQYDAVGSGAGVKEFVAGKVDFGASDAAMTDAEIAKVKEGVVLVPTTAGAVAVAYNLPNFEGELRLGRDTLVGIFAGEITNWDDPRIAADNPGANFPNRTIAVVTRRDSSGTTFAFTSHLSAVSDTWREDGPGTGKLVDFPHAMTAYGNAGVAGRIKVSQYSLGYVQLGFAERLGLPMAALQNRDGVFVKPSVRTAAASLGATLDEMPEDGRQFLPDPKGEESYPIVTYSWLLLRKDYKDDKTRDAVRDFVSWGVTDGQNSALELHYVPLPQSVRERSRELVDQVQ